MRYVKCYNCGVDISAQPKYVFSYISESKPPHQNSKRQLLARFCDECGEKIYRKIGDIDELNLDKPKSMSIEEHFFESDRKKKHSHREYEKMNVEVYPRKHLDGTPFMVKKATLYRTKEAKLLRKLKATNDLLRGFFGGFIHYTDDIENLMKVLEIHHFIEKLLSDLGCYVASFTLNPEHPWIDLRSFERFKFSDNFSVADLDLKKIEKLSKYLQQVKTVYLDKMELKDPELLKTVTELLTMIYNKIAEQMVNLGCFKLDPSAEVIDNSRVVNE